MTATLARPTTRVHPAVAGGILALAGVLLLPLAVALPAQTTMYGLATFGLMHVAFELRYVIGRFRASVDGVLAALLVLTLSLIALSRVVASMFPTVGQPIEIILGVAILGLGVWVAGWRRFGLAAVALLGVAALLWPDVYFQVLTHIHNLIPVLFLWDWARRRFPRAGQQWLFLALNLIWAVVLPVGLLVTVSPAEPVVFALLQSMHYVVWIGFFPLFGREESREFDRAVPALRGWRLPALAVGAGLLLGVAFLAEYAVGRTIYSIVAAYHVYVEFPLLVLLAAGSRRAPRAVR